MSLVFAIMLSFFAVRGFRFELTTDYLVLVNTESFTWLLLFLFLTWILYQSILEKDKRLKRCAAAFAVIIAGFYILGISVAKMYRISWIWESKSYLINTLNLFFSHTVVYYSFAFLSFRLLRDHVHTGQECTYDSISFKRVFRNWGILILAYLPWYITLYPGYISPDSYDQLYDVITLNTLNDHHSAFLNLIMRAVILPIRQWTGSLQIAVGICILLQMLIVTFVFAFTYERLRRYLHSMIASLLIFLWFALFPIHQLFSVTLWKDILFSICFLALLLCIDAACNDETAFFGKKRNWILLFVFLLLLPLMRHNGLTIMVILPICFFFFFKKSRPQIIMGSAGVLVLYLCWKLILMPALGTAQITPANTWSTLEQQIVRTLDEHRDELSESDRAELESYFSIPEVWTVYNPRNADPVKAKFQNNRFSQDPVKFFMLWFRTGLRFPVTYIESFLLMNYGYWFPEVNHWISDYAMYDKQQLEDLHSAPILEIGLVNQVINNLRQYQFTKTPVLFLLFSPGAYWWLWIFCGAYALYQRKRKFLLFLSGLALWLGLLPAPISNDFRYEYGLIAGLPLVMIASLKSAPGVFPGNSNSEKNEV